MDKAQIEQKINELLLLKEKIDKKKKEVDSEIIELRSQLYRILDEEKAKRPPPNIDFLNEGGWA